MVSSLHQINNMKLFLEVQQTNNGWAKHMNSVNKK